METTLVASIPGAHVRVPIEEGIVTSFIKEHAWQPEEIARALRIGVEVLSSTGAVLDTRIVEKSFDTLKRDFDSRMDAVVTSLDPEGKGTPAAGMLASMRSEMREMISSMDPNNPEGPLGKLAAEMRQSMKLVAVEQGKKEVREELSTKTSGKGKVFEEALLGTLSRATAAHSDMVEITGDSPGIGGSKKGDLVISCAPDHTYKIVIEAKRKRVALNRRFIEEELRAGMANRGAGACILAVHPEYADVVGSPIRFLEDGIVACVFDPDSDDSTTLLVAYHYARQTALSKIDNDNDAIDRARIMEQITALMARVEEISSSERSLTILTGDMDKTRTQLQATRKGILADLKRLLEGVRSDNGESLALSAEEPLSPTTLIEHLPPVSKAEEIPPAIPNTNPPPVAAPVVVSNAQVTESKETLLF